MVSCVELKWTTFPMVRLGLGLENVRSWEVGRKSGGGIRRRLCTGGGGRGAEGGGGAARLLL
jgi:hypothetical protein